MNIEQLEAEAARIKAELEKARKDAKAVVQARRKAGRALEKWRGKHADLVPIATLPAIDALIEMLGAK